MKNLNPKWFCSCVIMLWLSESKAQITLKQDYQNFNSSFIGSYKGINYHEAGFSSLYAIPNTNGKEFWTISDRGVNIDCSNANLPACRPQYDKMYAFPNYAPKIHRIRINGDSVQILETIAMKRPNGTAATGLLNPTGFGSLASEANPTDTVLNCANLPLKTAPKDVWGIDSEGLVVDADGNFWISEEGGPSIWKLNRNGVVIKRFTPYASLPGSQPEDVQIDTVFKYRKNNRGFEGLSLTPNGKIYAIIQSPLLFPSKAVGEATCVHRILEIDPATNATRVFVYLNSGVIGANGANQIRMQDWKIGDMAAINDSTFLLIEAAARGTSDIKKLFKISLNGATPVSANLYNGKTVEGWVDSTGLAANAIKPVGKTLFMDLLANGWPSPLDKSEGLAIINDSTIALCNDNDYGQACPNADGLAIPTGKLSHVLVFGLKGANKVPNFTRAGISLDAASIKSSQTAYVTPKSQGVKITPILSVGDAIDGYKMAGIPDGLGAFDNNDGTFTLLMNHEISATGNTSNPDGVTRAHGGKGAFVSKWIINKSDLSVKAGSDLIRRVNLWNGSGYTAYNPEDTTSLKSFLRFCSADLPAVSAFYNASTGLGTTERIFMNGEEYSDERGRSFAHIVTGPNGGTSYETPKFGKAAWENAVANPGTGDKTVVGLMNDGAVTSSQVYFYIGTKTASGTEVDKAGLTNGKLYGVKVEGFPQERLSSSSINTPPVAGTRFSLVEVGAAETMTGAALDAASNTALVTRFSRCEDGAWDPSNLNDFYFNTTDQLDQVNDAIGSQVGRSRVWRLRFDDVAHPELGGTTEAVLDGTEGQNMLDNMAIDHYGHILLLEDVGNAPHNGKVWQYTIATDNLKMIAQHDSSRFGDIGRPATAPFNVDEETSGIIDVQEILGRGMFLSSDQAHYLIPGELVEGGQLFALFNPDTYNAVQDASASSSQTPYVTPKAPGVKLTSILSVADSVNHYKMAGIPDGLGAFDNNDGTFTLLMNHEISATGNASNPDGSVRAHGGKGAFVSKWTINKSTLAVVDGSDLIRTVNLWNGSGYTSYGPSDTTSLKSFLRFCSADLPAVSAFYNASTGLGTTERIYMNGEEYSDERGRAFAHIVTGPNGGTSYEMPRFGKAAWENAVASPATGDKTVVGLMNDGAVTSSQVYFYVGTKTSSGTEVDKAGLTNGKLYGVKVEGFPQERLSSSSINTPPTPGTRFSLAEVGAAETMTGAALDAASNTALVTRFSRCEDGAWDPSSPNDFYFNTTDQLDQVNDAIGSQVGRSRVWRLRFDDVAHPELGGVVEAVLDGTEGQNMLDNMAIDNFGHILLLEDVGNAAHNGKVWQYTIATDNLKMIAQHDSSRFGDIGRPATAPFNVDEETSGIIDVSDILGAGMFLTSDQAHYLLPNPYVEGGQLLALFNPDSYKHRPVVSNVNATVNEDATLTFAAASFKASFSDADGDTLTKVKITALPKHGMLKLSNNAVQTGDQIAISSVAQLTYKPVANFNGKDTLVWNGKDADSYAVLPAKVLVTITSVNDAPTASLVSPVNNALFTATSNITFQANANDVDGTVVKVEYLANGNVIGTVTATPFTFVWTNVEAGTYTVTCRATDNEGAKTTSAANSVVVSGCSASGYITKQLFNNVMGSSVAALTSSSRYPGSPSFVSKAYGLDGVRNSADNYGTRFIGYVCAPQTGNYTFYIAADDRAELWVSTNSDPAQKVLVASVPNPTGYQEYNRYPAQQHSAAIHLVKGGKYFIQVLHKEGINSDHISVAWQLPSGGTENPIPGTRLSPAPSNSLRDEEMDAFMELNASEELIVSPIPASNQINVGFYSNAGGNTEVSLKDALSNEVLKTKFDALSGQNSFQIELNGLKAGLYYVTVSSPEGNRTKKIIVVGE